MRFNILKSHVPEPLDQTAVRQMRAIVEEAEKEVTFR